MRAHGLITTLTFGCLAFGCSAVNAPETHTPEPVDATEFCERYANVLCDGILGCCSVAASVPRADCLGAVGVVCTLALGRLISDPRSGYDENEAGLQLAIGQLLVDSCDLSVNEWIVRRDGLLSIFTGSVEEGGACNPVFREDYDARPIVIDTPRFVSCGTELACQGNAAFAEWRCAPFQASGRSCVGLSECVGDLTCVPISDTAGECGPRLPDGSGCVLDTNCESYDCSCVDLMDPSTCFCRADDSAEQVYCGLATG